MIRTFIRYILVVLIAFCAGCTNGGMRGSRSEIYNEIASAQSVDDLIERLGSYSILWSNATGYTLYYCDHGLTVITDSSGRIVHKEFLNP